MSYRRREGGDNRTLTQRLAAHAGGDTSAFCPGGNLPRWERSVGDDIGILWECLLWFLRERGFLARCGDPVPITATSGEEFHSRHTTKFLATCPPGGWRGMRAAERKWYFREYLSRKFSTAPKPPKTAPRKADIKWGGFYLTPREFERLIDDAFCAYCHYAGHAPTA